MDLPSSDGNGRIWSARPQLRADTLATDIGSECWWLFPNLFAREMMRFDPLPIINSQLAFVGGMSLKFTSFHEKVLNPHLEFFTEAKMVN